MTVTRDIQIGNFVRTTIASGGFSAVANTLSVADASEFPALSGSKHYRLVLIRLTDLEKEIVDVTAASGNDLTVTRAQEGTTALAFVEGDRVELRFTKGVFDEFVDETDTALDANETIASNALATAENANTTAAAALAAANNVDTGQIAADAITGDKIEDDAVDTEHIADDAVEADQIADNAIGANHVNANARGLIPVIYRGTSAQIAALSGMKQGAAAYDETAFELKRYNSGGSWESIANRFTPQYPVTYGPAYTESTSGIQKIRAYDITQIGGYSAFLVVTAIFRRTGASGDSENEYGRVRVFVSDDNLVMDKWTPLSYGVPQGTYCNTTMLPYSDYAFVASIPVSVSCLIPANYYSRVCIDWTDYSKSALADVWMMYHRLTY